MAFGAECACSVRHQSNHTVISNCRAMRLFGSKPGFVVWTDCVSNGQAIQGGEMLASSFFRLMRNGIADRGTTEYTGCNSVYGFRWTVELVIHGNQDDSHRNDRGN
jgi:hypothetical protein